MGFAEAPAAPVERDAGPRYVGFWLRVVAAFIDSLLVAFLVYPLMIAVFGWDTLLAGAAGTMSTLLLELVLPAIAIVAFWIYRSATPGKMVIGAVIVDADTLGKPSSAQLIGRYFGYYVSAIPLMLGLLWVAFDGRKQGWHDKLAGTLVIRKRDA